MPLWQHSGAGKSGWGKFVVSGGSEAYDARGRHPNGWFPLNQRRNKIVGKDEPE
jgi:hypothetical protein